MRKDNKFIRFDSEIAELYERRRRQQDTGTSSFQEFCDMVIQADPSLSTIVGIHKAQMGEKNVECSKELSADRGREEKDVA